MDPVCFMRSWLTLYKTSFLIWLTCGIPHETLLGQHILFIFTEYFIVCLFVCVCVLRYPIDSALMDEKSTPVCMHLSLSHALLIFNLYSQNISLFVCVCVKIPYRLCTDG